MEPGQVLSALASLSCQHAACSSASGLFLLPQLLSSFLDRFLPRCSYFDIDKLVFDEQELSCKLVIV